MSDVTNNHVEHDVSSGDPQDLVLNDVIRYIKGHPVRSLRSTYTFEWESHEVYGLRCVIAGYCGIDMTSIGDTLEVILGFWLRTKNSIIPNIARDFVYDLLRDGTRCRFGCGDCNDRATHAIRVISSMIRNTKTVDFSEDCFINKDKSMVVPRETPDDWIG